MGPREVGAPMVTPRSMSPAEASLNLGKLPLEINDRTIQNQTEPITSELKNSKSLKGNLAKRCSPTSDEGATLSQIE